MQSKLVFLKFLYFAENRMEAFLIFIRNVIIHCYITELKSVSLSCKSYHILAVCISYGFRVTVCKTVLLMLLDHCLSCSVCNVGVLWPSSWMDEDATWHGGRPQPRPHKGAQQSPFSAHVYCAQTVAHLSSC